MANVNDNAASSASQTRAIREWLMQGKSITPMTALREFGCFRLGARIWDLRHIHGLDIVNEWLTTPSGKRIANYRLNIVSR